jgi:hypothetical protein
MSHAPSPHAIDTHDALLHRIRGEFVEMPGLRLTKAQAARLWHLDQTLVTLLLGLLVDARFLARMPDGAYRRAGSP